MFPHLFTSMFTVMDWGMMKNPSAAATIMCNPFAGLSNALSPYMPVSTRGEDAHRPSVSRSVSGMPKGPAGSNSHSCWYLLLRTRLRFGVAMSILILVTDVILRFAWLLRFYHKLFPFGDSFVLCSQFLEVFRRAIWNLLRVEWENLKQAGHHLPSKSTPTPSTTVQMIAVNPDVDEKTGLLNQRIHTASTEKGIITARKMPYEKNAEA